jgi:phospholipid/cholesterol/gamma-HCH transport system substrate-binding protein
VETEAKYALVGGVVVGLLLMAVGIYYWHFQSGRQDELSFYKIFFRQQSLAGLENSSTVTMRGIKVGSVRSFRILPDEEQGVEVVIAMASHIPVRTSTNAVIERNLLTGIASIDLTSSGPHNAPFIFEEQQPIRVFGDTKGYVIEEGKRPIQEIAKSIEDIMKNLDETLIEVRGVFSTENQQHISAILANFETMTSSFAKGGDELSTLGDRASTLISSAEELMATVRTSFERVANGVHQLTNTLQFGASSAFESMRNTSDRISDLSDGFEQPDMLLFGVQQDSLGPGEGVVQ